MRASIRVVVADVAADQYAGALADRFPDVAFTVARDLDESEAALLTEPHVVYAVKGGPIRGPIHRRLAELPTVEWFHVGGAGVDHLGSVTDLPCVVTNASGAMSHVMAETVIGAMSSLNTGLDQYVRRQPERRWEPIRFMPLAGQTVVIVGTGSIGRAVARHARNFDMTTIGVRRSADPLPDFDEIVPVDRLHEALPRADFLNLHLPHTPPANDWIGARELALLPRHARVINTARGAVVDEEALAAALAARTIAGAYLDVYEVEPLPENSPLWSLDNVILSPHYADAADGWELAFAESFADNLERWLDGRPLRNVIGS